MNMSFKEKILKAIKKIKGKLIVSFILWLILVIVFVAPMGMAFKDAYQHTGNERWEVLFKSIGTYIVKPWEALARCITGQAEGHFWGILWKFTLVYIVAVTIGLVKAFPKHEFDGIENGSSDWCTNGEQYSILSRKKGIILAEQNYLPVDKRGNVNVLVVGRIWFW